jgi:hypothetical protein
MKQIIVKRILKHFAIWYVEIEEFRKVKIAYVAKNVLFLKKFF